MDTVQFIIHRQSAFAGALLPYHIHINGEFTGTIRNGKTLTADVPHAKAYYIEDAALSERNAVICDDGREQYHILVKRTGGWRTESYNEFYFEQNGKLAQAPSFHFDKLYPAIWENRITQLLPAEQILAFCIEFDNEIRDDLQEVLASENLFSMVAALKEIGADQYTVLLNDIISNDFPNVKFPLNDEQIEQMQARIERANRKIQDNKSACAELHKALIHYMLENLDQTDCIY